MRTSALICVVTVVMLANRAPAAGGAAVDSTRPTESRVVVVRDAESISNFTPNPGPIAGLVRQGLTGLTGELTEEAAWKKLVSKDETLGIKVLSAPGPISGTRPQVVSAVVSSLLKAGHPPDRIIIWDKRMADLRQAGYVELANRLGVKVASSFEDGYDPTVFYEMSLVGKLVWGDLEFGKTGEGTGRKSFVSKLLTKRLSKIVLITPMLNHNLASVSGHLYSLASGSVDNFFRFETGALLAQAIPEICALPELGDRVVLNITDALICQYEGEERTLLHHASMLGELRMSVDAVALDVLSIQELAAQREAAKAPWLKPNAQLYENASALELGWNDPRRFQVIRYP